MANTSNNQQISADDWDTLRSFTLEERRKMQLAGQIGYTPMGAWVHFCEICQELKEAEDMGGDYCHNCE
jgi:hypothetical protein